MSPTIGINAFHGDASAAIVGSQGMIGAVEEERFTRQKHWAGFPERSIRFCLDLAEQAGSDQFCDFAVARRPKAYLFQKAKLALQNPASLVRAMDRIRNLSQVSSIKNRIESALGDRERSVKVHAVEHHLAHVASSFFCSPWEEAMCLTVDGFGDFVSTMMAVGRGNSIDVLERVHFPHSLGLFYSAITQYLGFPRYGDEYKVMGLTAYGEPRFTKQLAKVVPALDDGTFVLDLDFFRHSSEGVDMTWDDGTPHLGDVFTPALEALLGPRRRPEDELEQRHKDIAHSLQAVYEARLFALIRNLQARTGLKKLCLAGGCGMNSLANGKLFDNTDIEDLYIQAAAGDAGTALGAALFVQHAIRDVPRDFVMEHCLWGPEFSESEIRADVSDAIPGSQGRDGKYGDFTIKTATNETELTETTAAAIEAGEVIGWYQGRSEWGARALGNRSILADPRRSDMRELLNRKIKRRESFRPFAPSVLEEATGAWFEKNYPDPFMMKVYPVLAEKRDQVPAVVHVDGTGRLQTVSKSSNARYWKLIHAFEQRTGIPMLLNTSFNENEPIVNTPKEALDCFVRTKMDRLVLGDLMIRRDGQ